MLVADLGFPDRNLGSKTHYYRPQGKVLYLHVSVSTGGDVTSCLVPFSFGGYEVTSRGKEVSIQGDGQPPPPTVVTFSGGHYSCEAVSTHSTGIHSYLARFFQTALK